MDKAVILILDAIRTIRIKKDMRFRGTLDYAYAMGLIDMAIVAGVITEELGKMFKDVAAEARGEEK